jgi:DNA-binding response OmpR family regulator
MPVQPYVLVMEDEDALATLLSYNLEKEGYRVVVAADGGFPGSWHDKRIWERLVAGLSPDRPVLADKGYAGASRDGVELIRPMKKGENKKQPEVENHARKRVVVEHVFARMKRFRCLRWWRRAAAKHEAYTRFVAEICNIELEQRLAAK